jgi:pyridoxal phosphate enzyme (YggS family)
VRRARRARRSSEDDHRDRRGARGRRGADRRRRRARRSHARRRDARRGGEDSPGRGDPRRRDAGARDIGENYAQELRAKQEALGDLSLRWHFIGRLQKNKAKDVVGRVVLVHSVDSIELAAALGRRAVSAGVVQDVLAEVNVGGEATKGGVAEDEVTRLVDGMRAIAGVRCVGLMTIPPPAQDNRPHFRALAALARRLDVRELSMGMSDDYEAAIEEGATIVRVGTAIFGARG